MFSQIMIFLLKQFLFVLGTILVKGNGYHGFRQLVDMWAHAMSNTCEKLNVNCLIYRIVIVHIN